MGNILASQRAVNLFLVEMRFMRRRRMTTAISLAGVPRPSDIESEVLQAIDARQKLQAAIESENQKVALAESEFATALAMEISSSPAVNVDAVLQQHVAGKAAAERARQRIEALESVLEKVQKRIERLKADCPDAVTAAFTRRIEALEKTLSEKEEAEKGLEDQIKLLKYEVSKLSKATTRKAS
jgi:hypothetical protein